MTFRRRKWATDLSYRVMVSGDLIGWVETSRFFGEVTDNRDGTETVTIRDTSPVSSARSRFMRLEVE